MNRMTVIVPAALSSAAGHTLALMRKSASLTAYDEASWQDASGAPYAVSSGLWTPEQIEGVQRPAIVRAMEIAGTIPEVEGLDLELVAEAQANFRIVDPDVLPPLDGTKITAFLGEKPIDTLQALGLSAIPQEDPAE